MAKVIDSKGTVITQGTPHYCNEAIRVLLADSEDVSEEDEVLYEDLIRTASWFGELTINYND